jgi:hypothetical protein
LNASEETDVLPLSIDLRGQAQDNDSYGNQEALYDETTSNVNASWIDLRSLELGHTIRAFAMPARRRPATGPLPP